MGSVDGQVGAAHFRKHIEHVLRDHVLFLALLVGPRRLRSVASRASQRDGVDVVLLGAEQQFRGGPTPRAFCGVVHEVHQRTGVHVAEVLEHRFGRQCFGQNTGARHHNFVELACGNGVERSRNVGQVRLTGRVLNLSGGNVGQRAHVREFGADGMSLPGHFRRALRRIEGGESGTCSCRKRPE